MIDTRARISLPTSALVLMVATGPVWAQQPSSVETQQADAAPVSINGMPIPTDANGDGLDDEGEILVIATRMKGQVATVQPPVVTLDEEDIAAYGVSSLQELLAALAPQTGSGRGRGSDGAPVVLLNGMRVSGFREMRGLPPEAIRRVEVLPEEVALKYGYRPDQRVVNFILKDHFRSAGMQSEIILPARGGYSGTKQEVTLARIENGARLNVTGTYQSQSPLTEAERGIVQAAGSDRVAANYRTLLSRTRSAAINGTWARPLGDGAGLTLNALVQRDANDSLNGLRSADPIVPLARISRMTTVSAGAALNKPLGNWQLSVTADGSHVDSASAIDTPSRPAPDDARSRTDSLTSLASLTGSPFHLPGGEASLTVKTGFAHSGIRSRDTRSLVGSARLQRGDLQVGFSLDVPITSRRENFGSGIGNLSLNFNAEVHRVSGFGSLANLGGGLTWAPTEKLTLTASYIGTQKAPGLSDLAGPATVTPGVPIYDFVTGQTVLATMTSGGNPNLVKERQHDIKLAANWDLPFVKNATLLVEYFRNRSSDTTEAFPFLTPAIEAAFPDRVTRDAATGQIVEIDQSPVTFAQENSSRLRWGINIGGNFGKPDPNSARGGRFGGMMGGPPPGGGGSGRFGGYRRYGGGDGRGRWNLSITHTIQLTDRVLVTPGEPVLNLLGGDAVTSGGVARHSIEMEGGGFYRGFGLRFNGTYTGGSRVEASGMPGSSRLSFAPIARLDVRLFADFGRMAKVVGKAPFLNNARLSLSVDNLFDAQQRVTDANGAVPLRYQSGYLDPAGRVFRLELRKQF